MMIETLRVVLLRQEWWGIPEQMLDSQTWRYSTYYSLRVRTRRGGLLSSWHDETNTRQWMKGQDRLVILAQEYLEWTA